MQQNITKQPSMLDYSMSIKGVNCDLKGTEAMRNLKGVQTVLDSYFPDTILGNDAANFIETHGHDYIQGNGGKDIYKVTANCKNTYINNFDANKDRDIILIEQNFDDLSIAMENTNQSLELTVSGFGTVLSLLHWFKNETYRHAALRSKDGVTGSFPRNVTQMASFKNKLRATEISLDMENCSYGSRAYDLNQEHYLSVLRFTAKSELCSYNVTGNGENNYIDPGPGNPYGYQYLEGGNGSDTYVIGSDYGEFNEINNYATDDKIDFVLLNVGYKYIEVTIKDEADLILRSTLNTNNVSVALKGFLYGKDYQHLLLQSSDKVLFRLLPHYPHKKAVIVNYAQSSHSQIFNLTKTFPGAGILYGPKNKTNIIYGSDSSTKLSGGLLRDKIEGGRLGETIEGLGADDMISGNGGNDVIYGGDGNDVINGNIGNDVIFGADGADRINGSDGMGTVIFQGDSINAKGVTVSLKDGYGQGADAEGDVYTSIEAVMGSEFNDIIEGSDSNNILSGTGGNDTIISYSGYDILVGGRGNDFYNLTTASDRKVINNFATDNKTDVLMLGKTTEPPCLYSYKDDLLVHLEMDNQHSIDLLLQNWYNGTEFQHLSLVYADNENMNIPNLLTTYETKNSTVASDEFVALFREKAKVKIMAYDNDSVTVEVEHTLNRIPLDSHQIALNYVSEGQDYLWIDISTRLQPRGTLIELKELASGVMTSVGLSLHRCSQVLTMTLPVIQRTSPNPPSNLRVIHLSEVSITVQWDLPSNTTDPNSEFYTFKCMAEPTRVTNMIPSVKKTVTSENETSCLLDKLRHNTNYLVAVYSIAGGEKSRTATTITQKTDTFCKRLEEPRHGMIIDAEKVDGIAMATLGCDLGYELTVVGSGDTKISTVSQIYLDYIILTFLNSSIDFST